MVAESQQHRNSLLYVLLLSLCFSKTIMSQDFGFFFIYILGKTTYNLLYKKSKIWIFSIPKVNSLDKGHKMNVHNGVQKVSWTSSERHLNVLRTFNLRPMSRGKGVAWML